MNDKLTQEQLVKVVAEVEQLARVHEDELDREQVKQILRELNLSPDLLDEAMIQLSRREALATQQKRNRWIGVGIACAGVGAIAFATFFIQHQQQLLSRIEASQSRLTLTQDTGGQLTTVDRQARPEVYYRVTLQEAPVGKKLSLKCNWIDPSGQIVHQNSYQTLKIDKEVWSTYCHYQFGPAAKAGDWNVEMSLGDGATAPAQSDRILSRNSFRVK